MGERIDAFLVASGISRHCCDLGILKNAPLIWTVGRGSDRNCPHISPLPRGYFQVAGDSVQPVFSIQREGLVQGISSIDQSLALFCPCIGTSKQD